ncbi:MAG TPA: gluconate 2-dehydrogenase subunit 3 family protein [Mucilaginibacter sp.]|nr:gluconate 2-dehydrogenase subunit 3 family protein [Mucilaginibacter sp.]
MNRRTVIKNLALVIGGAVLLPSCVREDGTSYVKLKHVDIDEDQQKLIADVAETIIPKTDTPGAKDLNLPAFVLKMIDDCFDKKQQRDFLAGLTAFREKVKKENGKDFGELDNKKREEILTTIEKDAGAKGGRKPKTKDDSAPDPVTVFYWGVKGQTIFAYTTSQYFMTKQIVYELVPGRYIVHYPVSKLKLKTA